MLQPEVKLVWDHNRKGFIGEKTDPGNGVQTSWEIFPPKKIRIRTDKPPITKLSRRIWDTEDESGPFSNSTLYSIEDSRAPLHKHLELTIRKPTEEMRVHVNLSHLKGGFDFFSVHYDSAGLLSMAGFAGNLQAGTWPQQFEAVEARPYEECFDNLIQVSKIRGLVAFFGPIGKSLWKQRDPTVEDIAFITHLGLLTFVENLPEEQLPLFYETALKHATTELERRYGGDEFVRANSEVISLALTIETVNQFAEQPNPPVPFLKGINDYFKKTVKHLFADYYKHIQKAGEFSVDYYFAEMSFQIASNGEIKLRRNFRLGEPITYEEYSYTLRRGEQTNQLQAVIGNILRPGFHNRFEFPEMIDISRIHTIITTSQNSGWEEALQLTPVNYKNG